MLITPAKFEDEMRKQETPTGAVLLMEEVLKSLGYEAGIRVYEEMVQDIRKERKP